MAKSKEEVIAQFNEEVNMSVEELEQWLEDPKSRTAGTGVGIESGHKIIEILRKNPAKDPEKYDEEDLEHMRKVVGYTNRHRAQEDHLKEDKTLEELENAKSTISLKNWGHDPVKTLGERDGDGEVAEPEVADDEAHNGEVVAANGHAVRTSEPAADEATEITNGVKETEDTLGAVIGEEPAHTTAVADSEQGLSEKTANGDQEQPAEETATVEVDDEQEQAPSKKRKLGEDEPTPLETADANWTKDADADGDVSVVDESDEVEVNIVEASEDAEEHPTKKSKVDDAA